MATNNNNNDFGELSNNYTQRIPQNLHDSTFSSYIDFTQLNLNGVSHDTHPRPPDVIAINEAFRSYSFPEDYSDCSFNSWAYTDSTIGLPILLPPGAICRNGRFESLLVRSEHFHEFTDLLSWIVFNQITLTRFQKDLLYQYGMALVGRFSVDDLYSYMHMHIVNKNTLFYSCIIYYSNADLYMEHISKRVQHLFLALAHNKADFFSFLNWASQHHTSNDSQNRVCLVLKTMMLEEEAYIQLENIRRTAALVTANLQSEATPPLWADIGFQMTYWDDLSDELKNQFPMNTRREVFDHLVSTGVLPPPQEPPRTLLSSVVSYASAIVSPITALFQSERPALDRLDSILDKHTDDPIDISTEYNQKTFNYHNSPHSPKTFHGIRPDYFACETPESYDVCLGTQIEDYKRKVVKRNFAAVMHELENLDVYRPNYARFLTKVINFYRNNPTKIFSASKQMEFLEQAIVGTVGNLVSGLDKTIFPHDQPLVQGIAPSDMSTVNTPRQAIRLGVKTDDDVTDQSSVVNNTPFNGNISKILCIPNRLDTFEWSTTKTVGFMQEYMVTPAACYRTNITHLADQYDRYEHNNLSFFSTFFEYWRGDITFDIEVLPTGFHRGQLLVGYVPHGQSDAVTISNIRNVKPEVIEVGTKNRTSITIPWNSSRSYHLLPPLPHALTPIGLKNPCPDDCLGKLIIVVQNPLVRATTAVSTAIDVNIYVRSDNMFFKVYRNLPEKISEQENSLMSIGPIDVHIGDVPKSPIVTAQKEADFHNSYVIPTSQPPFPTNGGDNSGISKSAISADTISTDLVYNREYLLDWDRPITTSSLKGSSLYEETFPLHFMNTDFAAAGFAEYFTFMRCDWKFTIKIQPTSMHAGCLAFYAVPTTHDDYSRESIQNFPGCLVNLNEQNEGSFFMTYPALVKMLEMRGNHLQMFRLIVTVWNKMRTGTASTSLKFSIYASPVNSHVAVPTVKETISSRIVSTIKESESLPEQNTITDTATEDSSTSVALAKSTATSDDFMTGDHMNLYELLKRPEMIGRFTWTSESDLYFKLFSLNTRGPLRARLLKRVFSYYSGSVSFIFSAPVGMNTDTEFSALYDTRTFLSTAYNDTIVQMNPVSIWNANYSVWNPAHEPQKEVNVPFYSQTPLKNVVYTSTPIEMQSVNEDTNHGTLNFICRQRIGSTTIPTVQQATVFWKCGEDYSLTYLRAVPRYYIRTSVKSNAEQPHKASTSTVVEDSFQKDLTGDGDIESNPGPSVLSKADPKCQLDDEVALGCEQFGEALIAKFEHELDSPDPSDNILTSAFSLFFGFASKSAVILTLLGGSFVVFKSMYKSVLVGISNRIARKMTRGFDKIWSLLKKVYEISHIIISMLWLGNKFIKLCITQNLSVNAYTWSEFLTDVAVCLPHTIHMMIKNLGPLFENVRKQSDTTSIIVSTLVGSMLMGFSSISGIAAGKGLVSFVTKAALVRIMAGNILNTTTVISETISTTVRYWIYGDEEFDNFKKIYEVEKKPYLTRLMREWVHRKSSGAFLPQNINKIDNIEEDWKQLSNDEFFHFVAQECKDLTPYVVYMDRLNPSVCRWREQVLLSYETYIKSIEMGNKRPEPIGLCLMGEPGVGKSILASELIPEAVLEDLGMMKPESSISKYVYAMSMDPKHNFFDDYRCQPVLYMDDFGSNTEGTEWSKVINIISPSSFVCNMADLQEKGTILSSQFLFITTNLESLSNDEKLTNSKALTRRFPFTYNVTLKGDYTIDTKLDYQKMVDSLEDEICASQIKNTKDYRKYLDKIFSFEKIIAHSGASTGQYHTFEQIVKDITELHTLKRENTSKFEHLRTMLKPAPLVFEKAEEVVETGKESDAIYSMVSKPIGAMCNLVSNTIWDDPDNVNPALEYELPRYKPHTDFMSMKEQLCAKMMKSEREFGQEIVRIWTENADRRIKREHILWYMNRFTEGVETYNLINSAKDADTLSVVHFVLVMNACTIHNVVGGYFSTLERYRLTDMKETEVVVFMNKHRSKYVEDVSMFRRFYMGICDAIKSLVNSKTLLWLISAIAITTIAAMIVTFFDTAKKKIIAPKQGVYGPADTPSHPKKPKPPAVTAIYQSYHSKIASNQRRVYIGNSPASYCLLLDDQTILMPTHVAAQAIRAQELVYIDDVDYHHSARKQHVPLKGYMVPIVSDVILVKSKKKFQNIRDIKSKLLTKEEHWSLKKNDNAIFTRRQTTSDDVELDQKCLFDGEELWWESEQGIRNQPDANHTKEIALYTFQADYRTTQGHCGLAYRTSTDDERLIALHMASTPNYVHAIPIVKEEIEFALQALPADLKTFHIERNPSPIATVDVKTEGWLDPSFEVIGRLTGDAEKLRSPVVPKSCHVKSLLHDEEKFPSEAAPAQLSRKILIKRAQKYGFGERTWLSIPRGAYEFALDYFKHVIHHTRDIEKPGELTDDQIINATGTTLQPMARDTSLGYWKASGYKRADFLKLKEVQLLDGPAQYEWGEAYYKAISPITGETFEEVMKKRKYLLDSGVRPESLWTSSLKDEVLPLNKVQLGKTRVFEIPGFDMIIDQTRCFGRFLDFYQKNPGFMLGHYCGVDPDAVGVEVLKLLQVFNGEDTEGFEADFSQYDSCVDRENYEFFADVMDVYYNDYGTTQAKARRVLLNEICMSDHVIDDILAASVKANNSGCKITLSLNSLINAFNVLTSYWIAHMEKFGTPPTGASFIRNVRFITMGDDIIVSAKQSTLEWWNGRIFGDILSRHGWVATSVDKSGGVAERIRIQDATFVKRIWRKENGYMYNPLPKKTLYKVVNFIKREHKNDITVQTQMLEQVMFMAAHWGKNFYDEFVGKLNQAITDNHPMLAMNSLTIKPWVSHKMDLDTKRIEGSIRAKYPGFGVLTYRAALLNLESLSQQRLGDTGTCPDCAEEQFLLCGRVCKACWIKRYVSGLALLKF